MLDKNNIQAGLWVVLDTNAFQMYQDFLFSLCHKQLDVQSSPIT